MVLYERLERVQLRIPRVFVCDRSVLRSDADLDQAERPIAMILGDGLLSRRRVDMQSRN